MLVFPSNSGSSFGRYIGTKNTRSLAVTNLVHRSPVEEQVYTCLLLRSLLPRVFSLTASRYLSLCVTAGSPRRRRRYHLTHLTSSQQLATKMTTKFGTTNFSVESLLSSNEGNKSTSRSLAARHHGLSSFSVQSFLASASQANANSRSPSPVRSISRQSPSTTDSASDLSPRRSSTSDRIASHQMAAVAMAASQLNAAAVASQRVTGGSVSNGPAISWSPAHLGFQAWLRSPSSLSPGLSK